MPNHGGYCQYETLELLETTYRVIWIRLPEKEF